MKRLHKRRGAFLLPAACLLALPSFLGAESIQDRMSFVKELGGSISLSTGRFPDGSPGSLHMGTDEETGQTVFHGEGRIRLQTPDMLLRCDRLEYVPDRDRLVATGNVEIETESLEATAELLVYRTDNQSVELEGQPHVRQETANGTSTFDGMQRFVMQPSADGLRLITLEGPEPIIMETIPAERDGEEEDARTAPDGLGNFGHQVRLVVNPRGDIKPRVRIHLDENDDLALFNAAGSVLLTSEDFNLRSDELSYYARDERFEAIGSVYVRHQTIEADAGRMIYDIQRGRITLTMDPDVRQVEEGEIVARMTGCDQVIVTLREGEQPDVQAIGGEDCEVRAGDMM